MGVRNCRIDGSIEVIDLETGRKFYAGFTESKVELDIDREDDATEYVSAALTHFAFAPVTKLESEEADDE